MRNSNRRHGRRIYKQMRSFLAVGAPSFVLLGLLGLFGLGEFRSNGEVLQGNTQTAACAVTIILGLLGGIARLTIFRLGRYDE
jgi:hypothetical protein